MIPVVSTIGADANGQATTSTPIRSQVRWLAHSVRRRRSISPMSGLAHRRRRCVVDCRSSEPQRNSWYRRQPISGGMIPKVEACMHAVESGATSAHMLDGRIPHVLLLELFTDAGIGTMITGDLPTEENPLTAAQAAAWGATGDHSPLMDNYGSPLDFS